MSDNRLLDAIDALTKMRNIPTIITDDDGHWLRIHTEEHNPLLVMLVAGVSSTGAGSASSDPGIPVDAEALEIVNEIRGTIRSWSEALEFTNPTRMLGPAIRRWYQAHVNEHRSGGMSDSADLAVTRTVEGWVNRIEAKFDPPQILEWLEPCPGWRVAHDGDVEVSRKRCGARRVIVDRDDDKIVQAAIIINVNTLHASCSSCRTEWNGERGFMQLRFDTNLVALESLDEAARKRDEEFLRHATDTVAPPVEDASVIG